MERGVRVPSERVAADHALRLIDQHPKDAHNEIADLLYWTLPAEETQALASRPLELRCRCGRGLGYAHYHDGTILIYRDAGPKKVALTDQSGYSLVYEPASSVVESNRLRPAGFAGFDSEVGAHGYLRRTLICPKPKGCGAEYPLEPSKFLVTWLQATRKGEATLRLGRSGRTP